MKKNIISLIASILIFIGVYSQISAEVYAENLNIGVICYHSISDNPLRYSQYCISDAEFEEDIKYFSENGYTFLKPNEMWYASPDDKNIVITSDDGYDNFYECAFPVLKKYNAKAAVYIVSSTIDKNGYLKSWQIKEMADSGLVEIGNHTDIMHKRSNDTLKSYYQNEVLLNDTVEDIKACSGKIYAITGYGTESFSYPYGIFTDRLDKIIRTNLGYTTTFTTDYGIVKTQQDILKPMKRIYRVHNDTPQMIEEKINSLK